MTLEQRIEQEWRSFVASDSRLSQFDPDTLEGVKNVFKVGCVVGARIGSDMAERQVTRDLCGAFYAN